MSGGGRVRVGVGGRGGKAFRREEEGKKTWDRKGEGVGEEKGAKREGKKRERGENCVTDNPGLSLPKPTATTSFVGLRGDYMKD